MIEATCHCGACVVAVAVAPVEVKACNCAICRRYGTLWSYYGVDQVRLPDRALTDIYMWNKREIEFHRCKTCGYVTHWWPVVPPLDRLGVNARLMPPEIVAGARLRAFPDDDVAS